MHPTEPIYLGPEDLQPKVDLQLFRIQIISYRGGITFVFFARHYSTTYDVAVEAYTKLEDIKIHALWRAHRFIYISLPSNPHLHELKWNEREEKSGAESRIRTDASLRILITNEAQSTTVPPRRCWRRRRDSDSQILSDRRFSKPLLSPFSHVSTLRTNW